MSQIVELAPGVGVPQTALRFAFARAGGPGGQNVNKLNTKAEIWLRVDQITGLDADALSRLRQMAGRRLTALDEIHVIAQTHRTQEANRADALERLRQLIVRAAWRPKPRRRTRPTAGARQRRLDAKRRDARVKSARRAGFDE